MTEKFIVIVIIYPTAADYLLVNGKARLAGGSITSHFED
jgi:hypothetical protein